MHIKSDSQLSRLLFHVPCSVNPIDNKGEALSAIVVIAIVRIRFTMFYIFSSRLSNIGKLQHFFQKSLLSNRFEAILDLSP